MSASLITVNGKEFTLTDMVRVYKIPDAVCLSDMRVQINMLRKISTPPPQVARQLSDYTASSYSDHSWLKLAYELAFLFFQQHDKEFLQKLLSTSEWNKPEFSELKQFLLSFFKDHIIPIQEGWVHSRSLWLTFQKVRFAQAPDNNLICKYWSLIGNLLKCGIDLSECYQLAGEACKHPWLVLISNVVGEVNCRPYDLLDKLRSFNDTYQIGSLLSFDLDFLILAGTECDKIGVGTIQEAAQSVLPYTPKPEHFLALRDRYQRLYKVKGRYLRRSLRNLISDYLMISEYCGDDSHTFTVLSENSAHEKFSDQLNRIKISLHNGKTLDESLLDLKLEFPRHPLADPVIYKIFKAAEDQRDHAMKQHEITHPDEPIFGDDDTFVDPYPNLIRILTQL